MVAGRTGYDCLSLVVIEGDGMPGGVTPFEEDLLAALDPSALTLYQAGLAAALEEGAVEGRDRTAAFLRGQLRGWGIPTVVQRFDAPVSIPGAASLSLARRDAPVAARPFPYSAPTPPAGLVAELRAVSADDAAPLAGMIALVDGVPTVAMIAALAARGAVAQVYIGADEALSTPLAATDRWGAPVPTPIIAIGRAVGEGFLALCAAGPTPVRLHAELTLTTRRLLLPVATLKGADEPDKFVLVGAPGPSTADGGEAAACLLELCRVFAAHAGRLRRGVRFVWWPQGATAMTGPLWYTDHAWPELRAHAVCAIALTSEPQPGVAPVVSWAEETLRAFANRALDDGGWDLVDWSAVPPYGGEQGAFARLGLSVLRLPAAGHDRLDACVVPLARLCTAPLLPHDLLALSRAVAARIEAVAADVPDIDLAALRGRGDALVAATERAQIALLHIAQADAPSYEEGLELGNRLLRRLGQVLLPALRHAGDPYALAAPAPDTYPLLPGLDAFVTGDPSLSPASPFRRDDAIRERNRAIDACDAAILAIEEALTTLRPLGFG
jgi:hypothetical protein